MKFLNRFVLFSILAILCSVSVMPAMAANDSPSNTSLSARFANALSLSDAAPLSAYESILPTDNLPTMAVCDGGSSSGNGQDCPCLNNAGRCEMIRWLLPSSDKEDDEKRQA